MVLWGHAAGPLTQSGIRPSLYDERCNIWRHGKAPKRRICNEKTGGLSRALDLLVDSAGLMPAADEAAGVTAEQAIQSSTEGNTRFAEGKSTDPAPTRPAAPRPPTVGSTLRHGAACADSRLPVEIVFDRGIGDLFVVRDAGNICNVDERGSIEYGVEKLGTPVVLVLGHSECGAVDAAIKARRSTATSSGWWTRSPRRWSTPKSPIRHAREGYVAGGHGG